MKKKERLSIFPFCVVEETIQLFGLHSVHKQINQQPKFARVQIAATTHLTVILEVALIAQQHAGGVQRTKLLK